MCFCLTYGYFVADDVVFVVVGGGGGSVVVIIYKKRRSKFATSCDEKTCVGFVAEEIVVAKLQRLQTRRRRR